MKLLLILIVSLVVRWFAPIRDMQPVVETTYGVVAERIRDGKGYTLANGARPILYYMPGFAYWRSLW